MTVSLHIAQDIRQRQSPDGRLAFGRQSPPSLGSGTSRTLPFCFRRHSRALFFSPSVDDEPFAYVASLISRVPLRDFPFVLVERERPCFLAVRDSMHDQQIGCVYF